jgi:hypothetical protein
LVGFHGGISKDRDVIGRGERRVGLDLDDHGLVWLVREREGTKNDVWLFGSFAVGFFLAWHLCAVGGLTFCLFGI